MEFYLRICLFLNNIKLTFEMSWKKNYVNYSFSIILFT